MRINQSFLLTVIYHLWAPKLNFRSLLQFASGYTFSVLIRIWIFFSLFSLSFFPCLMVIKYRSLKRSKSGQDITHYYKHFYHTVMRYQFGNLLIFQILAKFYFLDRSISLLPLFFLLSLQLSRHINSNVRSYQ